jgi:hypothetical protein
LKYCDLLVNLCSASNDTVTMHYSIHHWPDNIDEHGSLGPLNAQGLEASNQASKNDGKPHCNRQSIRKLMHGGKYNFANHQNYSRLWRHVKTAEQKIIRKGHKIIGVG